MLQAIPARAETVVVPGVGTVVVFKHGSAFLAVRPDFEDIQLSPTGMGGTPATAVEDLLAQERRAKSLGYFVHPNWRAEPASSLARELNQFAHY